MGTLRKLVLVAAMALVATACGSDDAADEPVAAIDDTSTDASTDDGSTDDGADEPEPADEEPAESEEPADDDAEEPADEPAAVAPVEVRTSDIAIVSIDFSTAEVVLRNTTDAPIDLDGYFFCNFPDYAEISGVGTIDPGETITVTSTVAIPAADGELGLYASGDFGNAEAIVAYAEWGADGHTRAEVAIAAGIWDGTALTPEGDLLTVAG